MLEVPQPLLAEATVVMSSTEALSQGALSLGALWPGTLSQGALWHQTRLP